MSDHNHITSSSVFLRDLRIHARHGVLPQERTVGADFVLNVSIDTDFSAAAATDQLDGTISYADVAVVVRREMAQPSALLEHVAHRIAAAILNAFSAATAVEVELTKTNPPMPVPTDCGGAGVKLRLVRGD